MDLTFIRLKEEASKITGEFSFGDGVSAGAVAAALLTWDGKLYTGICMDFFCGIGFCAEHAAVAEMLKSRETKIDSILAITHEGVILPPCGRCRELLVQLDDANQTTRVYVSDSKVVTLSELLPCHWLKV